MRIRARRAAGLAAAFALLFVPVREYAECAMRGTADAGTADAATADVQPHAGHGGTAEQHFHAENAEPAEASMGAESSPPAPREPVVPASEAPAHCPDAAGCAVVAVAVPVVVAPAPAVPRAPVDWPVDRLADASAPAPEPPPPKSRALS